MPKGALLISIGTNKESNRLKLLTKCLAFWVRNVIYVSLVRKAWQVDLSLGTERASINSAREEQDGGVD